tara:strand:- start:43 stop:594 length:552 start_codon:yes stop_codon:yes gene_type:complete
MAISNDWTNKSLKIQQEIEKADAYQAGVKNVLMMIGQHASPYIPQERPREGVGGTDEHPFDDFGNDRNRPVINPATGKPEWAGTNKGMTIAGGPYRMNKEGNVDEVWEFGGPNYHYNPMPKSYYDLIKSVKGMNFKKADAAAGTKIINELPRGGWPSRNSHRGLVDDNKLIDTMKRATAAFKA